MVEHGAAGINIVEVQGRGDKSLFHHVEQHGQFNDAAGPHAVAHVTLQAGDQRPVTVDGVDGLRLDHITHLGGGGMGRDQINIIRADPGIIKGQLQGGGYTVQVGQDQVAAVVVAGKADDLT